MVYDDILSILEGISTDTQSDEDSAQTSDFGSLDRAIASVADAFATHIGLSRSDPRWGYVTVEGQPPSKEAVFERVGAYRLARVCIEFVSKASDAKYPCVFPVMAKWHENGINIILMAVDQVYAIDSTNPKLAEVLSGMTDDMRRIATGYRKWLMAKPQARGISS